MDFLGIHRKRECYDIRIIFSSILNPENNDKIEIKINFNVSLLSLLLMQIYIKHII